MIREMEVLSPEGSADPQLHNAQMIDRSESATDFPQLALKHTH
jgi:hypothetical protein